MLFEKLAKALVTIEPVDQETALEILSIGNEDFPMVMGYANKLRIKTQKQKIQLCSIMNARNGACSEDCTFCAQSGHHENSEENYPMLKTEQIVAAYTTASHRSIDRFGVVTSGEGLSDTDIDTLCKALKTEKNEVQWCASLGILTGEQLKRLYAAGLRRYHHNLETSKSFFPHICSTHLWESRADMVRRAKKVGFTLCCGGIFGVGETLLQRYELASEIYDLETEVIPLNFHIPIKGTRLENQNPMTPMEILKTIAMFRFTNPQAELKIAAGRTHLRDLQAMIFWSGANSLMIGDLLTVSSREVDKDLQMLNDLELSYTIS